MYKTIKSQNKSSDYFYLKKDLSVILRQSYITINYFQRSLINLVRKEVLLDSRDWCKNYV